MPQRSRKIAFVLLFLGVISPIIARAMDFPGDDDKALPCRPTVSCTADLAATGTSELEAGYLFRSEGATGNQSSIPLFSKLTLAPWVQVQVGSGGYTDSTGSAPAHYFDDVTVGTKFHVLDQSASMPSISFSTTANLPTATHQNGYLRAYDALFTLFVSRDFGVIHADFNAGSSLFGINTYSLKQEFLSLALSYGITDRWSVAAETYYFTDASPVSARDSALRAAFSYALKPWLIFDFGGDLGFIPSNRIYSAFTGMTLVPAVLWRTTKAGTQVSL